MATVQNHSKAIIEALQTLPGWIDFDPELKKWTTAQIAERFPVWNILPSYWKLGSLPSPKERVWLAICGGTLIGWDDRSHSASGPSAPGSLDPDRIVAEHGIRPATVLPPEPILATFRRSHFAGYRPTSQLFVIRNEWVERAAAASAVRELVLPWIYETRRIVVQADLDPSPLDELMKSTYMQDEVVDRAVAVLRKVAPQPRENEVRPVEPTGIRKSMTGKDAAKFIGVDASTLSRWQSETPAWASESESLFRHLIERTDGRYERENVTKLQAWFREAMKSGGQDRPRARSPSPGQPPQGHR
jgi:hypothetical protein